MPVPDVYCTTLQYTVLTVYKFRCPRNRSTKFDVLSGISNGLARIFVRPSVRLSQKKFLREIVSRKHVVCLYCNRMLVAHVYSGQFYSVVQCRRSTKFNVLSGISNGLARIFVRPSVRLSQKNSYEKSFHVNTLYVCTVTVCS